MNKVIVFGAGISGRKYITECSDDVQIVAVSDNNKVLWEEEWLCGHPIIPPNEIPQIEFDFVVVCIQHFTHERIKIVEGVVAQLLGLGIHEDKIILADCKYSLVDSLVLGNQGNHLYPILETLRFIKEQNVKGALAECGVWTGEVAGRINAMCPDRKLYLFDTFEGFNEKIERDNIYDKVHWQWEFNQAYSATSENIVKLKCINRSSVVLRKGFIPETFSNLDSENFAFVHIDLDIYKSTLDSLRFFGKRMSHGGVILIHDYHLHYGVKMAVAELKKEMNYHILPVGQNRHVGLIMK